jgi:glucosylceramidase
MKHRLYSSIKGIAWLLAISSFAISCNSGRKSTDANSDTASASKTGMFWLTNPDKSVLFQQQSTPLSFSNANSANQVITVNASKHYQEIDGFGFTLTGGSAQHIIRMGATERAALLKELFATDGNNIGLSYLRVSIGASDLNERVFSYNDLPEGQTDPEMKHFDLGPDTVDVIPVLKEILAINPAIKILGSPWSAPVWMKTINDTRGGSLKPEWHNAYAKYFVRYVQEMKARGIRIDAITVQNEPLHPGNNPSMLMLEDQQAIFVRESLGPAFKAANIDTKIIIYDHNADRPDYPLFILNDPKANPFVDGSAFHLYAGPIDTLTKVHDSFPDKNLYFTEQWIGAPGDFPVDLHWMTKNLTIGATRNWCRNVLQWNLANDPQNQPHTDRGGCDRCLGGVTIDGNNVTRNPGYYIAAHASKFVRPGSVRIESNNLTDLPNVAFATPDGKKVLIVLNDSKSNQTFGIKNGNVTATATLMPGAVGTFVF